MKKKNGNGGRKKVVETKAEPVTHYKLQRMRHWLLRAKFPSIGNGCARWRARRNYWFLVRKYPTLAGQHGFRETSVF
jgi:hypothetical protein